MLNLLGPTAPEHSWISNPDVDILDILGFHRFTPPHFVSRQNSVGLHVLVQGEKRPNSNTTHLSAATIEPQLVDLTELPDP